MNPVTDNEIRIPANSKIGPFARWLRNQSLPKNVLIYWGQKLIRDIELADPYGSCRLVLIEAAITILWSLWIIQ